MLHFEMMGAAGFGPGVQAALKESVRQAVLRVALDVRENVIMNVRGDPIKTKSGALLRSWSRFPETGEDSNGAFAKLSSSVVYSAIHEFGGTVRPVGKAFLTIPLAAAQNPSGTRTKFGAGELRDNPGLLGFDHTFVNRGRTAILGVRPGKPGEVVPLFAIRDSVEIPARKYVSKAVERTRQRVPALVGDVVDAAFRKVGLS